jgi:hypothetical protein
MLRKAAKTWLRSLQLSYQQIENLCVWRLNWLDDIQLSYRESPCDGQVLTIFLISSARPCAPFPAQEGAKDGHFQQNCSSVRKL